MPSFLHKYNMWFNLFKHKKKEEELTMRLMDTKRDLSSGGGNFFRLGEGQTARVRFVYNTIDDIKPDGLLVHVIKPEMSGQRYNTEFA